jgi:nucleotide-binding universal stress UspA family protein
VSSIATVLCPVDFSRETGPEVALAEATCRLFGARLVLEHNLDPRPPSYLGMTWMWSEEHERQQRERGEDAERRLREGLAWLSRSVECEAKLTRGPIDTSLLWLASALPADLIVMASHGRTSPEHRSLTEEIVAKAPCPVLAIGRQVEGSRLQGEEQPGELRLLVPVTGEATEEAVLESLRALDAVVPLRVELIRVERRAGGKQSEAGRRSRCEALLASTPEPLRQRAAARVVSGDPVTAVLEAADRLHADLIVVGAHRRRMFGRHAQAVDSGLLHSSHCPVWFVPPEVKVSAAEARR